MAMIFPSATCHRFTPGHNVNMIQWRKSLEGPWRAVELVSRDGMTVEARIDDRVETWRFHDEDYDRTVLGLWHVGEQATISRFALVKVKTGYLYPCRKPQDWLDCRVNTQEPVSDGDMAEHLAEQANELGGFMVPLSQVPRANRRGGRNR